MDLQKIRANIDAIDLKLLELLAKRFEVAKDVAAYKKEHGLPVLDKSREVALIKDRAKKLEDLGIDDPVFVAELYEVIMKKSKEIQEES